MSWDIFVQDIPTNARTLSDIPAAFSPSPLCERAVLIRRIQELVPAADFADPTWGCFDTPSFSVEFNLGEDELIRSFALHVRGDESAAAFVSELLSHLGFRAFDPLSSSGLFEPGSVAEASVRRWREYRDHVVG